MLVTATDLFVGFLILGSMAFTLIYILDHVGGGESYFNWKRGRK